MRDDDLTGRVIGLAIDIHKALGPGLLESAYHACLCHELERHGVPFQKERKLPVRYRELVLEQAYRIDLIVEGRLVVELKAVDRLLPIHEAQVLTYLRLSGIPVGLLINFNSVRLIDGVRRLMV
ncbi:MAG TPA: GxxExxY protein [Alphaproteobacteria bacterium]|nr:GxxExxY protein [Alphaproteobacteria bacterium]